MFKQNKYQNFITTVSFFLLVLLSNQLLSQTRYTVLLPEVDVAIPRAASARSLQIAADNGGKETVKTFFKFNFKQMPLDSKVESLKLKMYNDPNSDWEDLTQLVTVLKGTNGWSGNETSLSNSRLSWANIINNRPIGRDEVTQLSTSITMNLNTSKILPIVSNGILSLAARSPEKNRDTKFYSSITSETPSNFSKKPKLIASYGVGSAPFRTDWTQPFSTAQHNSYLSWETNATTKKVKVQKLPNLGNDAIVGVDPTGAVSIYKNQPIIFTQSATGTEVFYVKQLDAKGNVIWSQGVDGIAKCWPLIDEKGRLYYIEANKLKVLDLNNSGKELYSQTFSQITSGKVKSINDNATIGYDGTLYLTTNEGVVALSAYPQLKIRWMYKQETNELNGTVSLSPDESKAFFINVNTQQGRSRLIVLDNMDGSLLGASDFVLGGYKSDQGNYYIPAPVVQNKSTVFVLNGYDNGDKLYIFDIDTRGSISKTRLINSGGGGISQPVIDGDSNVFFVFNKKMARYDVNARNPDFVEVFNSEKSLDNASILVTNKSSHIYANDPYSNPKKMHGFSYDSNSGFKDDFSAKNVHIKPNEPSENIKKNIALAADGTLYTVTANNLIAIKPTKVSVDEVTLSDLKKETVYRASKSITVNGIKVESSVNTILYSGGTISFKSGFSVSKGAELTCITGY